MWWKLLAAVGVVGVIAAINLPMTILSIKVDLPPAVPPAPACKSIDLRIMTSAGGPTLTLNGAPTTGDNLLLDMAKAHDCDAGSTPVHIMADSKIQYGEFMALIDELQRGGYFKVTLVTENPGRSAE
jgi:biopolymer transport protein ExbD